MVSSDVYFALSFCWVRYKVRSFIITSGRTFVDWEFAPFYPSKDRPASKSLAQATRLS